MSQRIRKRMASSKPGSFFLRSTSALSLNERFSQVLLDQLTRSRIVTFDPVLLQQRQVSSTPPVVLLMKEEPSSLLGLQDDVSQLVPGIPQRVKQRLRSRGRGSVWTRLGWRQVTRRLSASQRRGFWSFRNKYRWRARSTIGHRRRGNLRTRQGQCCLLKNTNSQKLTAGQHLRLRFPIGGATALKGRGQGRHNVPTKKQLDAQLDDYMSKSKSRLDEQLDDYMSKSRRRLDAELDEYMLMAGDSQLQWD